MATRQEKIMEGTAKFLYEARGGKDWKKSINKEEWLAHAFQFLSYLQSQGGVMKAHVGADLNKCEIVAVESLIGEK